LWFATATTVAEAKSAEQAGADAIIAQGMEAGGHCGAFRAEEAEQQMVGLWRSCHRLQMLYQSQSLPQVALPMAGESQPHYCWAQAQCRSELGFYDALNRKFTQLTPIDWHRPRLTKL